MIDSHFDFDRFGLIPHASPRQADLIITEVMGMPIAPALKTAQKQEINQE